MNLLENLGACVLLEYLKTLKTNQEQIMSKQTELQDALNNLKAAVAEQNAAQVAKLEEIGADVQFLRDAIASGNVTDEHLATANKATEDIKAATAALKAYDAVTEHPAEEPTEEPVEE